MESTYTCTFPPHRFNDNSIAISKVMATPLVTEDYYEILEVSPNAPPHAVKRAYKRLVLRLHPDKNLAIDTTRAFQTACC